MRATRDHFFCECNGVHAGFRASCGDRPGTGNRRGLALELYYSVFGGELPCPACATSAKNRPVSYAASPGPSSLSPDPDALVRVCGFGAARTVLQALRQNARAALRV